PVRLWTLTLEHSVSPKHRSSFGRLETFVKLIPLFALLLAGFTSQAQHKQTESSSANNDKVFELLAEQYFDKVYFKFNPSQGTAAGFHQYDNLLEDYSRASINSQLAALKNFQKMLAKIDPQQLSPAARVDHTLVLDNINAHLLTLEQT